MVIYLLFLILKKKKGGKSDDDDEDDDDDEEDEDDDDEDGKKSSRKPSENSSAPEGDETNDGEADTIDLKNEIEQVRELVKDKKLLLVKSLNWEDNIIIDVNSQQQQRADASGQANLMNDVIVSERVKNAGWVASGEHRTMMSFQSKVLGIICLLNEFYNSCLARILELSKIGNIILFLKKISKISLIFWIN